MTTATDTETTTTPTAPATPAASATAAASTPRVRRKEWWIVGAAGMVLVGSLVHRMFGSGTTDATVEPAVTVESTTEAEPTPTPTRSEREPRRASEAPVQDRREVPALAAADALFRERRFDEARKAYAAFLLVPTVPSAEATDHLAWARARHALCLGRIAAASLGDVRLPEPAFRFEGGAR
jgi:hypothetical protein